MNFPSYFELIKHHNFFLLSGPTLLLLSLWLWASLIRRRSEGILRTGRRILSALSLTLFASVHFMVVYASVLNACRFRGLQVNQVVAFSIEKMKAEGLPENRPPVIVKDNVLIQEGLSTLTAAKSWSPGGEEYRGGYRIQLLMDGAQPNSVYYLSVYQGGDQGAPVTVVIPHLSVKSWGSGRNGGEYSCIEFGDWIRRRVDPLF